MAAIVKKYQQSDVAKAFLGFCYEKQKPVTVTLRKQASTPTINNCNAFLLLLRIMKGWESYGGPRPYFALKCFQLTFGTGEK